MISKKCENREVMRHEGGAGETKRIILNVLLKQHKNIQFYHYGWSSFDHLC